MLLLTSLSEGFPKVLIEGIFNKISIISTPTLGNFLINNKHYIQIPFGNSDSIISNINLLNENELKRSNMINEAYDYVSSYPDTSIQIQQILNKINF